jgi:NAD(P)H-dependent flavin oxidoreductase YrpB (nitropropane dioxygenase family)
MHRFVATEESNAHPTYKRKLVELDRTEYTNIFGRARWPNAPQRALVTPFFNDWKSLPPHENEINQPVIGRSTINGEVSLSDPFFCALRF